MLDCDLCCRSVTKRNLKCICKVCGIVQRLCMDVCFYFVNILWLKLKKKEQTIVVFV